MPLAIVPLTPIEPGQRGVFRVRAARFWSIALLAALAAEYLVQAGWVELPVAWVPGVLAAPVALLWVWRVMIVPGQRWRRSAYAFTGTELHVAGGLLFEYCTIVPVFRVQHIDIFQGPIERLFKVCVLVVHTAGGNNVVPLAGLSRETAEEIRNAIRARIGSAAA